MWPTWRRPTLAVLTSGRDAGAAFWPGPLNRRPCKWAQPSAPSPRRPPTVAFCPAIRWREVLQSRRTGCVAPANRSGRPSDLSPTPRGEGSAAASRWMAALAKSALSLRSYLLTARRLLRRVGHPRADRGADRRWPRLHPSHALAGRCRALAPTHPRIDASRVTGSFLAFVRDSPFNLSPSVDLRERGEPVSHAAALRPTTPRDRRRAVPRHGWASDHRPPAPAAVTLLITRPMPPPSPPNSASVISRLKACCARVAGARTEVMRPSGRMRGAGPANAAVALPETPLSSRGGVGRLRRSGVPSRRRRQHRLSRPDPPGDVAVDRSPAPIRDVDSFDAVSREAAYRSPPCRRGSGTAPPLSAELASEAPPPSAGWSRPNPAGPRCCSTDHARPGSGAGGGAAQG